jgi:uncharacterized membrane protein
MVMSRIKFVDIFAVIISLIPFAFFIALRDSLADRIPIHWNAAGEVNGWAERDQLPMFLGLMAAFGMGIYLILRFMVKKIDPKRTAQLNEGITQKIGIGIVIFMSAINTLILLPNTGKLNIAKIVLVMVSLLFTFLGNLMYNIKPNYFIGIRLPWTLESENNWKLTHRLAGVTWFIGGLISATLSMSIEPRNMFTFFIVITMLLVLVPSVYSFILYKRTTDHTHSQ